MSQLPDNLVPIPTQPWDRRPAELPIEVEEARTAIWRCCGNITKAAELVKVAPSRLRNLVKNSPYLQREVDEAKEQLIDTAEDVIRDALGDPERKDAASRFVLSTIGRSRGWGTGAGGATVNVQNNNIVIQWQDGTPMEPTTIEGKAETIDG